MLFFKNYGIQKAKDISRLLGEAIVKFDPEGATEAAIAEIEEKFDKLNLSFSNAKKAWEKEHKEAEAITALYNQRLAAAEFLQANPEKAAALNQLVTLLEDMQPDIEREKQEADDAKLYMDELEGLVKQYADKLKTARHTLEQAKRQMAHAELLKERAQDKAEAAKMASGLSGSSSSLSSALDHINKLAENSLAAADAANRKASLLQPTQAEDNPDIKAAMDAVSGKAPAATSIQDRLAALKKL
ncbi:MAG: hypothetical protein PHU14_01950 [Methylovulum sp.]|nr:hypothetical protein [Methylovulum sp.]